MSEPAVALVAVHTIPVPSRFTVLQAWEAVSNGVRMLGTGPGSEATLGYANVAVYSDGSVREAK